MCLRSKSEQLNDTIQVREHDKLDQAYYSDKPFVEELKKLDLFNPISAALPVPTGATVSVRVKMSHGTAGSIQIWAKGTTYCLHEVHMQGKLTPAPCPLPEV